MSVIQSFSVLQSGTIAVTSLSRSRLLAKQTSMTVDRSCSVLDPGTIAVTILSCLRCLGYMNFREC
jgi:hypothetical protein